MKRLSLQTRLLLLLAVALAPALIIGLYDSLVRGAVAWKAAILVVVVYIAALASFRRIVAVWCARPDAAAIAAPVRDTAASDSARPVDTEMAAAQGRERELQANLAQRDHLLRELHHRVKNNLQMLSSLLSLQAGRIRSPRIRRIFGDAQNRVLALSVLHRHLYERTNWAEVDFQAFLNDLVRHLSVSHEVPGRPTVRVEIDAPIVAVGPDTAIPIGLIVTEAVTNAFRHAFAVTAEPRIAIRARHLDGMFELSVDDNGSGIAPDVTVVTDQAGLGFTLLRGLATQLGGEAVVARRDEGGTKVQVRFAKADEPAPPTAQAATPPTGA